MSEVCVVFLNQVSSAPFPYRSLARSLAERTDWSRSGTEASLRDSRRDDTNNGEELRVSGDEDERDAECDGLGKGGLGEMC